PFARFGGYRAWSRGKRSAILDLRDPSGMAHLNQLLETADVLVHSFRPANAARLELDPATLRRRHPQLVFCAISGYGQEDALSERPCYDSLISARLGLTDLQPGYREGPIFLGIPLPAYGAAFLAIAGTLAALHARSATGQGQLVDVSLFDGALQLNAFNWWWSEDGLPAVGNARARADISDLFRSNRRAINSMFRDSEGEYLHVHTGARGAFGRLMALLGLEDRVPPARTAEELADPLSDDETDVVWTEVPRLF